MTDQTEDEVIEVKLPRKDYKIMRELIEERQAMNGMKVILARVFWVAGGLLTLLGLFEIFKRIGA